MSISNNKNQSRTYGAAHFAFEIDGKKNVGFLNSIEGGGVKADVQTFFVGNQLRPWRQIGVPKYEDVKVQVGMSMSEEFYDWISSFFDGNVIRKNGRILAADFHYKVRAQRVMYEMLISEVTLPTLDAQDKNACHMSVTLVPEKVIFEKGGDETLKPATLKNRQKLWTSNNFEFHIDGFEDICHRVSKVEGFTIKQEIHEYQAGNLEHAMRVPGRLEIPNLTFHLPESDARPFIDYFSKHTMSRQHAQDAPRGTGQLAFRGHDGKTLGLVDLYGIDLFSVEPSKSDSGSEEIKTVKIEITVEEMGFEYLQA